MVGKIIVFSVAALLLFGAGCSKNRGWLSRNDFSEMQDPFMGPDSAIAKSDAETSSSAGRASLDDSEPSVAHGQVKASGPKPIRQTGASVNMMDQGQRISPANYPDDSEGSTLAAAGTGRPASPGVTSYSGPALSDFLQKKKAAARDVATDVDQIPARTVSSANATARNALNPAATRAALPSMDPEVESFNNFLTEKSERVAKTAERANQQVQETSGDVNNFASWAEQQKSEWSTSANAARSTVAEAPAQTKETARSVFHKAQQASREFADSALTPEFDNTGSESAEPLIQRSNAAPAGAALLKAKAPKSSDFTADANPFADSFQEFHSSGTGSINSGTAQKSATSSGAASKQPNGSLDDSFRMDTGWKPAHMTHP